MHAVIGSLLITIVIVCADLQLENKQYELNSFVTKTDDFLLSFFVKIVLGKTVTCFTTWMTVWMS